MSTALPVLETERLLVRPFVLEDLGEAHRVLSDAWAIPRADQAAQLPARERWLRWSIANEVELAELHQLPLGDRAVVRRADGRLIGSVGLVPALGPFGQLPGFPAHQGARSWFLEVGLFWAIDPAHQGRGYATEAAQALITGAVAQFHLGRFVATTETTNARSQAVMRKLGMRILSNPEPEPAWFQVIGVLEVSRSGDELPVASASDTCPQHGDAPPHREIGPQHVDGGTSCFQEPRELTEPP